MCFGLPVELDPASSYQIDKAKNVTPLKQLRVIIQIITQHLNEYG
jgi:hypothetical protein